jgi:hypothetical protein
MQSVSDATEVEMIRGVDIRVPHYATPIFVQM